MTKPTVTIERCQQIGHQLNLQVTLTCPVPPVYPKLSVVFTCGERTRIIPMAFTDSDGTTLRAQKTVELAYVFYEPPVGQPMGITFLYTDGVHGYQPVEPDQPYQVTCPPRRALRHFLLLVILRLQGVGQFLHGALNAPGHKGGVVAVKVPLLAIAF